MITDTIGTTLRHELGEDGVLVLNVRDGDIRIRGVEGTAVTIRARDGRALDGLQVERGERSLTVAPGLPGWPFGSRRGSVDLDVDVPRQASVILEAASADLDIDGLGGDQRFRTASGDVTVRGLGGRLSVEAMSGDIDIAASGAVSFDGRTMSGDLALRAATIERLRATSTSGDLTIAGRFAGEGPFTVETVSGDATLAPGDAALRVDVRTITGDVRSKLPHRVEGSPGHRSLIIGRGGPTVSVRTTSGDIRVTGDAAPSAAEPVDATPTAAAPSVERTAPEPTQPATTLSILQALERGEIDVDDARRRLAVIDPDEETDDVG